MARLLTFCLFLGLVICVGAGSYNLAELGHKTTPQAPDRPSNVGFPDYQWLEHRLARRMAVSGQMVLDRFGRPESVRPYAIGADSCWYYECFRKNGLPGKLQVIVSDNSKVRRARLY